MRDKTTYQYDYRWGVLIKCPPKGSPKIMDYGNPVWRDFGPDDEPYERAIYLGQGCWEDLDPVTEEEAREILTRWGYSFENE